MHTIDIHAHWYPPEWVALLEEEVASALQALQACTGIEECAVLTTCNRTELYVVVSDTELGLQSIRQGRF